MIAGFYRAMMETLSGPIGRIALLGLIVFFLQLLPWPDITEYLTIIPLAINVIYFMDPLLNLSAGFIVVTLIVSIEVLFLGFKIFKSIINFITSGHWTKDENPRDYG